MAEKKFEEAMERLEQIVRDLEQGDLTLEASLQAFEEGMGLIRFCTGKLDEAEKKVTVLIQDSGGKPGQVPFDIQDEVNDG